MKMILKNGLYERRNFEVLLFTKGMKTRGFTKHRKRLKILKKVLVVITLTVYNGCG